MDSRAAEELCLRWMPRAAAIAYLLTGDIALSRRIAHRAVLRCSAHWRDRRNPYALEEWFDQTVTSIAARSLHVRAAGRVLLRKRVTAAVPAGLEPHERRLWVSLQSLRYKQRVALVLKHYEGLTDRELADAVGCSLAGARSWLAHGLESLEARLGGGADLASQLEELLPKLAASAEADLPRELWLIRRVRSARWVGVLEAGCVAAGLAVAGYLLAGPIVSRGSSGGEPPAVAEVDAPGDVAGRVQIGAPGWCPDIRGAQPLSSAGTEGPITSAAEPFAIDQAKGRRDLAVQLSDPRARGPSLATWPRLESVAGLELAYSLPGRLDRALRDACGGLVAERSWIVVLQGGHESDLLALYLLRRGGEWKVWATSWPAIKL